MDLHDIIDSTNKLVDKSKGRLVLHKSIKINSAFKVYKKYIYTVYLVCGTENTALLRHEHEVNSPSDKAEKINAEMDKEFLMFFINWLITSNFKELTNGI